MAFVSGLTWISTLLLLFVGGVLHVHSQDTQPPVPQCPSQNVVPADSVTNTAVYSWVVTATDNKTPSDDLFIGCVPPSGSRFKFGAPRTVVCTAIDLAGNVGVCTFDVQVTGESCPFPRCSPTTEVCTLLKDGNSFCLCKKGYLGQPCENRNECEGVSRACAFNAECTNLEPPEFFKCECKEGYHGNGRYKCEPIDDWPHVMYPDIETSGSEILEKRFLMTLSIDNSNVAGCRSGISATSGECIALVNAFKVYVSTLYRNISPASFRSVTVEQNDIKVRDWHDSVIIPHTISYDYALANADLRGLSAKDFFYRSVHAPLVSYRRSLGELTLEDGFYCRECWKQTDITDVCTAANKTAIQCAGKRVLHEERTSSSCIMTCISVCDGSRLGKNHCGESRCTQKEGQDPVCSFSSKTVHKPEGDHDNTPLIVGLTVGLGGGFLLLVAIVSAAVYLKKKEST